MRVTLNLVINEAAGAPVYDSGVMTWENLPEALVRRLQRDLTMVQARVSRHRPTVSDGYSIAMLMTIEGASTNYGRNNLAFNARMEAELILVSLLARLTSEIARSAPTP